MRRTPATGTMFALNAAGLCGLPPFNGFIGELVIYCGAFIGIIHGPGAVRTGAFAALAVLALTGGIAAAALAKAVGAVFLGEARSPEADRAKEVPRSMNAAVLGLFGGAVVLTVFSPVIVAEITGSDGMELARVAAYAAAVSLLFTVLAAVFLFLQNSFRKRGIRRGPTWDCGYAKPDSRMEYTGTAFTQPLADFFSPVLRLRKHLKKPQGEFPSDGELEVEAEDGGVRTFWKPLSQILIRAAERCHTLQSGNLHFYIVLILMAVGGMLVYAMMKGHPPCLP